MDPARKKKPVKSDVKSKRKKSKPKNKSVSNSSPSCNRKSASVDLLESSNTKTPKQLNVSSTGTLLNSLSKTPCTSTPRSSLSVETPCSFYKITEDEEGKPVFSKSLLKYFSTVDSPEMDDLKNKRWNTSFLHETPKPNRVIRIFTEEEDNDPKYSDNMPNIESNLPEVPGSLHADIFKSIPVYDSDEELKKIFQAMTPVKEPSGKKKKRKSRRISCYSGKPLPDELLSFDYDFT